MAISRVSTSRLGAGLRKYATESNSPIPLSGLVARYESPPSSGSTWVDPVGGYNLSLAGTTYNSGLGGYLQMGTASNSSFSMNGSSSYTFSFWLKPTNQTGTSYTTALPIFGVSNTSTPGSFLTALGSNGIYINGYDCNGINAAGVVTTNAWQMITFVMKAGNTLESQIFVNDSVQPGAVNGYGGSKPTPLTIGYASTLNTNNYAGFMASIYIWNRQLTGTEVIAMYNNTKGRFGL